MMYADLHTHTTYSDGRCTPAELMSRARARGLRVLAVTDHDTVGGWSETRSAADRHALKTIPGVEISATVGDAGVHLLGYGFDPSHEDLQETLASLQGRRHERIGQIVERLQALGLAIECADVHAEASDRRAPGRPHVAEALVRRGIVASHEEAFARFLGNDAPAYVRSPRLAAARAIQMLHDAGGIAVLAHPGHWTKERVIQALVAGGLDGIETVHPAHEDYLVAYYRRVADRYGLVETGGSDYHGRERGQETVLGTRGLTQAAWKTFRRAVTSRNG